MKRRKANTMVVLLGIVSCVGSLCLAYAVPTLTRIVTGEREPPPGGAARIGIQVSLCIAFLLFLLGLVALVVGLLRILGSRRTSLFRTPSAVATEPVRPSSRRGGRAEGPALATEEAPLPDQPEALMRLLDGSQGERVRMLARIKLGKMGQAAVEAVFAALHDGGLDAFTGVHTLISILNQGDLEARRAAAGALGRIGHPDAVEPLVATALGPTPPPLRADAEEALLAIGRPALAPIIKRLKDHDRTALAPAAGLLGRMGDPRAVRPLVAALRWAGRHSRGPIVEALGQIGGERATAGLVEALQYDEVRSAVAGWLVRFGEASVGPLIAAIKSEDEDDAVREAAAGILQKIDHEAWEEVRDHVSAERKPVDIDKEIGKLRSLLREAWGLSRTSGARLYEEYPQYKQIRAIGSRIYRSGGFEEMQRVYYSLRVSEPPLGMMLDHFWHGIGGWMK